MGETCIGTSGWDYPHWQGVFYPKECPRKRWLGYYAGVFNCVELNVTFYRLPKSATFENWCTQTPEGFHFVAKGSRFITHIKRLKDVREPLDLFFDTARGSKTKLAAVLWQLPPSFKKDTERLGSFCKLLKERSIRQVVEFRNETWFDEEVYDILKKFNICLAIAHSGRRFPCVREVTADYLYLRFHGGDALYASDYSEGELREWADFARNCKAKTVFASFNNDARGYAVKNALMFRNFLEK